MKMLLTNWIRQARRQVECRRYAPLLTAYAEGALDARRRERVAAHLNACPACQQEVEGMTRLGEMLRAHPPAVPQLSPDLWSRIQAEIASEPAPTPAPRTPAPAPGRDWQWRSFVATFAPAMVVVAAVTSGIILVTDPLLPREKKPTLASSTPRVDADDQTIRVTLVPRPLPARPKVNRVKAPGAEAAGQPSSRRKAISRKSLMAASLRSTPAVRRRRLATPRPISRPAQPEPDSFALAATDRSLASAPPRPQTAVPLKVTMEPRAEIMTVMPADQQASDSQPPTDRTTLAYTPPDPGVVAGSIVARDVPAPASPADLALKLRAQQILFTYSGK